jgi:hypothetical protein
MGRPQKAGGGTGVKGSAYHLTDRKPSFGVIESLGGLYIGAPRNAEKIAADLAAHGVFLLIKRVLFRGRYVLLFVFDIVRSSCIPSHFCDERDL